MDTEKPRHCQQRIRIDNDEWTACEGKAVRQIGAKWYCDDCASFQQAHIDSRELAISQGVIVTPYGEMLRPKSPYKSPDTAISRSGGIVHHVCDGWVDLKSVSEHYSAFHCRACGLRVVMSNDDCKTWASLALSPRRQADVSGIQALVDLRKLVKE